MEAELDLDQKLEAARRFKDTGNEFFNSAKYSEAVEAYNAGLRVFEGEHLMGLEDLVAPLHLNLSACFLELSQPQKAVTHANSALQLQRKNLKGLYRRGLANYQLGNFEAAKKDFVDILRESVVETSLRNEVEGLLADLLPRTRQEQEADALQPAGSVRDAAGAETADDGSLLSSLSHFVRHVQVLATIRDDDGFVMRLFKGAVHPGVRSEQLLVFNLSCLVLLIFLMFIILIKGVFNASIHLYVFFFLTLGLFGATHWVNFLLDEPMAPSRAEERAAAAKASAGAESAPKSPKSAKAKKVQ